MCFEGNWLQNRLRANKDESISRDTNMDVSAFCPSVHDFEAEESLPRFSFPC